MSLKKGDIIKTALGDETTVLDVKDNQAVLFSGKQFVIASGIRENKKAGKFEWANGRYAYDLKSISNMQNNSFESMKETLSFLAEYNHSDFVKGIISLETGINNEDVLEDAYDNYMTDSTMGLIDEKFMDFIDEELAIAQDTKMNEVQKEVDIQEQNGQEINEGEHAEIQENVAKEKTNTTVKDVENMRFTARNDYAFKKLFGRPENIIILEDFLSVVLELDKREWLRFIQTEDREVRERLGKENKIMEYANTIMNQFFSSKEERLKYEEEFRHASDRASLFAAGQEKGREIGRAEGEQQGRRREKLETVRNMKADGIMVPMIMKYTGLTAEQIAEL